MRSVRHFLDNPYDIVMWVTKKLSIIIPDNIYLRLVFRGRMGYWPNLKSPKTFSEKIQWLKLYDRKPEYTMMVDKYAVKDYVAGIIGKEFIIPTLGVWNNANDIDFEKLPNRFVLKCTHDSGGVVICKDKSKLDINAAREKLNKSLKRDYYNDKREWPYKNVPRRIIAEQYIEPRPDTDDLPDYKFFCFNGEPKFCQVITGRNKEMCIDFFDRDWNHMPFHEPQKYPFAEPMPEKPAKLEVMLEMAGKLALGKSFSRIDFYNIDKDVYFGEITFYPTSGMCGFKPNDYDTIVGKMIDLPGVVEGGVIIRIGADAIISVDTPDLLDYKLFCFDGDVRMIQVDYNRFTHHNRNLYTTKWERIDAELGFPSQEGKNFKRPAGLDAAIDAAKKLSRGIPHVRTDFYIINKKVYFGELTFYHGSGMERTTPESFNSTMGDWLTLPAKKTV